jgi:uncharacterized DUF497 family protein
VENFTWNPEKRHANITRHGLDFADAERAFSGPTLTWPDTRFPYGEMRFNTLAFLDGTAVVISHTETEDEIHIISMRKAERHEREKLYASLERR